MRASFYQRRRIPGMRLAMRAEGKPAVVVPPGGDQAEEEESADELSDGESSDDEFSDEELSDDEPDEEPGSPTPGPSKSKSPSSSTSLGSGATTTTTPSTPPEVGTTATPIPNPSTIVAAPMSTPSTTTTATDSQPAQETGPSSSSLPDLPSTSTSPPQSSTLVSSSAIPSTTTSPLPVLNPGDLTTPTVELPQSTSGPTNVPQSDNAVNPPSEIEGGGSGNSQRARQIAGGVVGSIAFIALLLLAAWFWRRRRDPNRLSRRLSALGPDDDGSGPHRGPAPQGPGSFRSPSSIMNQLMTAAYAAEDGRMSYRDSREQIYDNYAEEKQQGFGGIGMHVNESTERLTVPAAAQLRPRSIAARTETTNRTESTWKTWGVLAGNSRASAPRNWWVDRYFRTT